jgi:hypothetical protein
MTSSLLGPPIPQAYAQSGKSLNEEYDAQRQKAYAKTFQGKTEIVYKDREYGYLFRIAVYATILFFILSNSATYNVANKLVATFSEQSNLIVDAYGNTTLKGNLIHTSVFFVIIMILLFFT